MKIGAECDVDIDFERLHSPQHIYRFASISFAFERYFMGNFFVVLVSSSFDKVIRVNVCGCYVEHANINHIESTAKFHTFGVQNANNRQTINQKLNELSEFACCIFFAFDGRTHTNNVMIYNAFHILVSLFI